MRGSAPTVKASPWCRAMDGQPSGTSPAIVRCGRCVTRARCSTPHSAPTAGGWRRPARTSSARVGHRDWGGRHSAALARVDRRARRLQPGRHAPRDDDRERARRVSGSFQQDGASPCRTVSPSGRPRSVPTETRCSPRRTSPRSCGTPRATTRKPAFVWQPGSQLYQASFTPNGAFVLTANEDGLARLWDVQTGKQAAAFAHDRRCALRRLQPRWEAAAHRQRPAATGVGCQRAAAGGHYTQGCRSNTEPVIYGEFSPDGHEILAVDFGATARIWNLVTGQDGRSCGVRRSRWRA